jgi:hypothetical protein
MIPRPTVRTTLAVGVVLADTDRTACRTSAATPVSEALGMAPVRRGTAATLVNDAPTLCMYIVPPTAPKNSVVSTTAAGPICQTDDPPRGFLA